MATVETYALPTWLYRFRPLSGPEHSSVFNEAKIERELEAIEQGYVYCATYRDMNDPMEGFYRSSGLLRTNKGYDEFSKSVLTDKLGLGIASFTESWRNEIMWAHYADGFRGICIAYKFEKLISTLDVNCSMSKMSYLDQPYYLNQRSKSSGNGHAKAILSTKNLKWAYEREWRLFAPQSGKIRYGDNVVPTVFLGMRIHPEHRKNIMNRLNRHRINVKIISANGYSLRDEVL